MASKYSCICGETVWTNPFSGNDVFFLVSENTIDISFAISIFDSNDFVDKVVSESNIVVKCKNYLRIALIDNNYNIEIYESIKKK